MPSIPLELEEVGTVTVIRITGKRLLGQVLVDGVSQSLLRLAGDPGRAHLLLDFSTVESLSSTVLATLLSLRKALLAQGGRLALCGLRPELREAFVITGLEHSLNLYRTEQEALQSFQ
jgi:anti-anti-sigma factor